ncbi:MAG: MBL fold metallo-hydrolase [Phycisphaerae bacterium]|nr:MBL fold metallo-hydrolase [Phycisphaerae bacterium]
MPTRMVKKLVGSVELLGYSLAGEETVIAVPELNVGFDFGRAPRELIAIDHVCLSHGHMDHAAGVAYYFSQRHFLDNAPGCAILHADLVEPVRRLLRAWADIEGHPSPAKLVGLQPGEDHRIRRDLLVRAFAVAHPPPSLGFAVIETRNKLKPEYAGYSGPQLVGLKKKGIEIEYRLEVPRVAYCGDTAAGAFLERPEVTNAEILLLECTFIDDDHMHRARAGQHLHIRDLGRILPRLACKHIVLTHLTRRSPLKRAKQLLAEMLDADTASRVVFLMDRPSGRRGQSPDESR